MRGDWAAHRERLLSWWITGENKPQGMKPWTFVITGLPGTRPWAWWEFDAPEPLGEHESERDYLQRFDLFLPGEEQLPTPEDRVAVPQAIPALPTKSTYLPASFSVVCWPLARGR